MCEPIAADDQPEFLFVEFNLVRYSRGVEAARVEVNGCWLWMSRQDVELNIAEFGPDPELLLAREAYRRPRLRVNGS